MDSLMRNIVAITILALPLGPFANAQQPAPGTVKQPEVERVSIKAGRLFDVRTGKITMDAVVLIEDDRMSDFRVQELPEEQMTRAVEVARRGGKRVMAHAEGTEGIKAAVRAGVDSIEHGTPLDDEDAELMARKGTWLVPTLETFQRGPSVPASLGSASRDDEDPAYKRDLQDFSHQ